MAWDTIKRAFIDKITADDYNEMVTQIKARILHSLDTEANGVLVGTGAGAFIFKTLAQFKVILGLGDAAYKNTGSSTGTLCAGDDSRLSNDRNPTAHKSTHATAGTDALSASDIGAEPANANIQSHIDNTSNPHSVTYTQTGGASASHGHAQSDITNLTSDLSGKEPAISKNTAFNKNYDTEATNIKMAGTQSLGSLDTLPRADHVHPTDTSRAATNQKLDDFGTPDNNTDLDANTTNHGLLLKATAPAANVLNVVGIANGETSYANKALFDATNPAMDGTAAPGTSLYAAHRDHVHPTDTSRIATADIDTDATFAANSDSKISSQKAIKTALNEHTTNTSNPHAVTAAQTGAATSTTLAQSIYVDKAATGNGTGEDWTHAFTTIQAAVDALPAIINHAVTIYVRKGSTPYRETVTFKRVIAAGSVTIRGEYYHSYQAATNTTANTLVKNASDDFTDVEVGDHVYLIQYSGTFDASTPSYADLGTVTDVTNKASGYVTISMALGSVTPTTGFGYVITKTEISGSDNGTTPTRSYCFILKSEVSLIGLHISLPNTYAVQILGSSPSAVTINYCTILHGTKGGIQNGNLSQLSCTKCCAFGSTATAEQVVNNTFGGKTTLYQCAFLSNVYNSIVYPILLFTELGNWVQYSYIKALGGGAANNLGISTNTGSLTFGTSALYGYSAGAKLAYGLYASNGGVIKGASTIDATTITTAKTPATWATTTDGSYIA